MSTEQDALIKKGGERDSNGIKLKYVTVIPVMFFVFLGSGLFNYIINEWTQSKIKHERFPNMSTDNSYGACNDTNHSDPTYINYKSVQQDTSIWMLYYSVAQHIPMFLVNTILTGYTDTYGRKFLFVLASFGICVKFSIITVVVYFNASLLYVTAMYAFDGLCGSSYALFAVSFSYIADITHTNNHRVFGIVSIEASMTLSFICSSVLSGYFIQTLALGFFNTAVISSATCLLGFVMIVLLLPETLPKSRRRPPKSLLGTVKTMLQFYLSDDFKEKRLMYTLFLLSFFFAALAALNRSNIETLYFLGQPFCWGPSKIGVFAMTRYAALGIVGLGSLKLLQMFLSNEAIAVISAISYFVSLIIEAFARSNLMIYMVPVTGIFSFLMVPVIRGMMSAITEPDQQGAMFSGIATIEVLSSIGAVLSLNEVYAVTYSFMNGFVFLVMAGFCVIDFVLLTTVYFLSKSKKKQTYEAVKSVQ